MHDEGQFNGISDEVDFVINNPRYKKSISLLTDEIYLLYTNFKQEINNENTNLYVDFDCTIVNSIKAIVSLYDEDFKYYPNYKKIDWKDINTWGFSELSAADPGYINSYFNQQRFFDKLEFMPDADKILIELSNYYNIVIVSHGRKPNLKAKEIWIKENMPYAKFIGVDMDKYPDKRNIDMSGRIFIDDRGDNLETSNAAIKICYGRVYSWNELFEINESKNRFGCFTWNDVKQLVIN